MTKAVNQAVLDDLRDMGIEEPKRTEAARRYHSVASAMDWIFGDGADWTPPRSVDPFHDSAREQLISQIPDAFRNRSTLHTGNTDPNLDLTQMNVSPELGATDMDDIPPLVSLSDVPSGPDGNRRGVGSADPIRVDTPSTAQQEEDQLQEAIRISMMDQGGSGSGSGYLTPGGGGGVSFGQPKSGTSSTSSSYYGGFGPAPPPLPPRPANPSGSNLIPTQPTLTPSYDQSNNVFLEKNASSSSTDSDESFGTGAPFIGPSQQPPTKDIRPTTYRSQSSTNTRTRVDDDDGNESKEGLGYGVGVGGSGGRSVSFAKVGNDTMDVDGKMGMVLASDRDGRARSATPTPRGPPGSTKRPRLQSPTRPTVETEDEQMARAIAASLEDSQGGGGGISSSKEHDAATALAGMSSSMSGDVDMDGGVDKDKDKVEKEIKVVEEPAPPRKEGFPYVFTSEHENTIGQSVVIQALQAVPQFRNLIEQLEFNIKGTVPNESEYRVQFLKKCFDDARESKSAHGNVDTELLTDANVFPPGNSNHEAVGWIINAFEDAVTSVIQGLTEDESGISSENSADTLVDPDADPSKAEFIDEDKYYLKYPEDLFRSAVHAPEGPLNPAHICDAETRQHERTLNVVLDRVIWGGDQMRMIFSLSDMFPVSLSRAPRAFGTGPAPELLQFPEEIYLDRFVSFNLKTVVQKRALSNVLVNEWKQKESTLEKWSKVNGGDVQDVLRAAIKHYQSPATEERSALNGNMTKALEALKLKTEHQRTELEPLVASKKQQNEDLWNEPQLQKHKYTLRSVCFWAGYSSPKAYITYVNHEGQWWKIYEKEATKVDFAAVLAEEAGLHYDNGPFLLLYSRDGARPSADVMPHMPDLHARPRQVPIPPPAPPSQNPARQEPGIGAFVDKELPEYADHPKDAVVPIAPLTPPLDGDDTIHPIASQDPVVPAAPEFELDPALQTEQPIVPNSTVAVDKQPIEGEGYRHTSVADTEMEASSPEREDNARAIRETTQSSHLSVDALETLGEKVEKMDSE